MSTAFLTMEKLDFTVETLGRCKVASPVPLSNLKTDREAEFVCDDQYILYNIEGGLPDELDAKNQVLELAGPREKIYFDPTKSHAAIVTCGGLCPGLNDVIRSIVMCLWYRYGVRRISGIRYGYRGFLPEFALPTMELSPDVVSEIHTRGGTILGSSRGYGNRPVDIVDSLERMGVNILFGIGGDGTQKGMLAIADEVKKRGLKIAVVGIPKTIDNDLSFIQKSFGFETAVSKAVDAVATAHVEAFCAVNGIGIVKVMGRQSGFIAAHTALAINDVNFVLVPEVPFDLDGPNGVLTHLENRILHRRHAVILIAEGAGQGLMPDTGRTDASGNKVFGDIGVFLKGKIAEYFKSRNIEVNIRYIDPSYIIRGTPADSNDSIYCQRLGSNAVHAAMAGKTSLLISLIHNHFVHLPIRMAVSRKNAIDPEGPLWRDVIDATGQPLLMKN
jgi:6-phosphofructokinase 1